MSWRWNSDDSVKCKCKHEKRDHVYGSCTHFDDGAWCPCERFRVDAKIPPKMSTAEFRSRLMIPLGGPGARCWGNVLAAFDVSFKPTGRPESTSNINAYLVKGGYDVVRQELKEIMPGIPQESGYTIAVFLGKPEHLTGDWVIYTRDHVLCVRDGKITDTMGDYQTVARRIESVYRVTRRAG